MRTVVMLAVLAAAAVLGVTAISQSLRPEPDAEHVGPGAYRIVDATVLAERLEIPWALAMLPDGSMLITERPGRIRLFDIQLGLADEPLLTVADVAHRGEGGLLGIALHPSYPEKPYVYIYYTYLRDNVLANRVVRFILEAGALRHDRMVIDAIPGASTHNGGRIKFGPDGYLYIATGDAANPELSQSPDSLAGKILRLRDDGSVPADNPFPGSSVYSLGHRNPQGLAWDSDGQLWATEHGAQATDELNRIQPGLNYGWPVIRGDQTMAGMEAPVLHSGRDTWAPSGLAYYAGSLFFAGLRGQSLYQVPAKPDTEIVRHLRGEFGRLREVVAGPEGVLYVLTSNRDGRGSPIEGDDRLIRIQLSVAD